MKTAFPKFIDSTARREFTLCQQKFNYGTIRHLRKREDSIHLHFGGCLARGLEVTRKSFYGEKLSLIQSLAAGAQAIIETWGDFPPDDHGKKTLETCLLALYEYFKQYPPESDIIKPLMFDGKPAVEFTFALPIPDRFHPETGEPLLYSGRFDMLASYGKSVFVVDEKTASALGESWANQFKMSAQQIGYCWAANSFGYDAIGAIIRGIGILTYDITHSMSIINISQWQIDRWLNQLQRDVDSMIAAWQVDEWDLAFDDACSNYGECPFLTLCQSRTPEKWIETHYKRVVWNPLHDTTGQLKGPTDESERAA